MWNEAKSRPTRIRSESTTLEHIGGLSDQSQPACDRCGSASSIVRERGCIDLMAKYVRCLLEQHRQRDGRSRRGHGYPAARSGPGRRVMDRATHLPHMWRIGSGMSHELLA